MQRLNWGIYIPKGNQGFIHTNQQRVFIEGNGNKYINDPFSHQFFIRVLQAHNSVCRIAQAEHKNIFGSFMDRFIQKISE